MANNIPRFKKGDYIINRSSNDLAIVDGVTPKNYYKFKAYYGGILKELKDVNEKKFTLQVDYQKFFDICSDEERKKLDEIISKQKK